MYSICFAITIFVVNKDCARVIEMNMTDCRKMTPAGGVDWTFTHLFSGPGSAIFSPCVSMCLY